MGEADPPAKLRHNLVITTSRLILRDWDWEDDACLAGLFRLRNDEPALKYVGYTAPKSIEDVREWLKKRLASPGSFNFIAELRYPADPAAVGTSANIIGSFGGIRTPEFGYQLHSDYWGNGYAWEAMRAIICAFASTWPDGMPSVSEDSRHKMVLKIVQGNQASIALAAKLGFTKTREEPEETPKDQTNGAPVTLLVYELEQPKWSLLENQPGGTKAYERLDAIGPNLVEGAI